MAQKIYLKKSSVQDKIPAASSLEFGELAINYASGTGKAFLATEKYDGTVATFHEDDYNEAKFADKASLSTIQADVSTIKSNYVNKTQLNAASGAAVTSAYTMAVNYINDAISGLSIGDYLTVDSATSVFNTIESKLSNFALSATVKNEISALTTTLEEDEFVIAQAFNEQNDRITALEEAMSEGSDYLTIESATSVFNTLNSNIAAANNKAQSAYTVASNVSGQLATNYYTKSEVDDKVDGAIDIAISASVIQSMESAVSYVTQELSTVNANVQAARNKAESAYTYADAISGSVYSKSEVDTIADNTKNAAVSSAFTASVTSANSYTDTKISTVNANVQNALNKANSAYTYADAISGSVYSKSEVDTKIATAKNEAVTSAYTASVTSANSYTDTQISTVNANVQNALNKANSAYTYADSINTNLVNNYYSKQQTDSAIRTAVGAGVESAYTAAVTSANSYTDGKVSTINANVTSLTNKVNAISSGYALSAVVKSTYWTSGETESKIGAASGYAYSRATAYTNEVSGNIESTINTVKQSVTAVDNKLTGFSAAVKSILSTVYIYKGSVANYESLPASGKVQGYVYNVVAAHGDTPAGTNYAWNGSEWDALGGSIDMSAFATSDAIDNVAADLSGFKTWFNSASGNLATKQLVADTSAATVAVAAASAKTYTNIVSGNIETAMTAMRTALQTGIDNNAAAISTINGKLNTFALSATVNSLISGVNQTILDNEVVTAAALTDLDWRLKRLSGDVYTNFVTSADLQTVKANVTSLTNRVNAIASGYALSAVVKTTYWTSGETQSKIAGASGYAYNQATAYTNTVSGYIESTINTLKSTVNGNTNKINAIASGYALSAVVKSTYWTSAETKNQIGAASGYALSQASAYTKTVSGNIESTINTVKSNVTANSNKIDAVSATVKNFYATHSEASEYASAALGNAMAYTDSKISGLSIGNYLTKESAGTMYSTLDQRITNVNNKVDATSGTVKATYWTSAETQTKINTATGSAYNSAVATASAYTKTVSGNIESTINSVKSNVTSNTNKINAISSGYALSAVVKSTYWTSAETQSKINSATGSAYNSATSYTKTVSGNIESTINTVKSNVSENTNKINAVSATVTSDYATKTIASDYAAAALGNSMAYTDSKIAGLSIGDYLTKASAGTMYNTLDQRITSVNNKVDATSGTVKATYWTSAETQNKINTATGSAYNSAVATASAYTKTVSGNIESTINTLKNTVNGNTNKINAITSGYALSAVVKSTYWTSAETQTKIAGASGYAYNQATAYTKTVSGYIESTINTVKSNVTANSNKIDAVSATVTNYYATDARASSYAAAALSNAMDYTDSKISSIGIGDYLTKASAGTMYNTLSQNITGVDNKLTGFSATVKSLLSTVYTYKGSVTNYSNLPATGQVTGYVYNVVNANGNTPAGTNYAWNGTAWDALGGTIDLSYLATSAVVKSQIDTINSTLGNKMDTSTANSTFVKKAGDTMTGLLTTVSNSYADAYSGALNMANSNIYGLNAIYTADAAENAAEGINFYRDTTHVDSLWMASGKLNFTPNRQLGTNGTTYEVYHTGNLTIANYATTGALATTNSNVTANTNKINAISATVTSDFATKTEASTYAAAALGNSMAYTDSKIGDYASSAVVKSQIDTINNALAGKSGTGHTHDGRYIRWNGSAADVNAMTWGTLTTANGYTILSHASSSDGGDWGLTSKGGQIFMQLDGYYYQREGNARVVDTTDLAGYVPTGRTVNGHTLNANVSVTKGDVGLGNVENTALSTWTGNTSIKSVGTITTGTWNGSKIANAYLVNTGITIDGTATALGGSVSTKYTQQANDTGSTYRPLLLGANSNAAQASIPTATTTSTTYFNKEIYAQPSTGELGATKMKVGGHVTLQYNTTTEALDFIFS